MGFVKVLFGALMTSHTQSTFYLLVRVCQAGFDVSNGSCAQPPAWRLKNSCNGRTCPRHVMHESLPPHVDDSHTFSSFYETEQTTDYHKLRMSQIFQKSIWIPQHKRLKIFSTKITDSSCTIREVWWKKVGNKSYQTISFLFVENLVNFQERLRQNKWLIARYIANMI